MNRRGEKLFPEPESMSPFIKAHADQNHKRPENRQRQRQGNTFGIQRTFDLNLLVAFDILMQELNVTHAAEQMFITQSA